MTTASCDSASSSWDKLLAGPAANIRSKKVTLLSGQNLTRGAVVGKANVGTGTAAAKSGGNTGNGTFVIDATTPVLAGAIPGVYTLRVIDVPAAHGSIWELVDPNGVSLGNPVVAGSGGTKTVSNHIKGVLTDGSTDFIVGDGFDITVAAGTGKYKSAVAAAVDGSAEPDAILAVDADASAGDVEALVYLTGDFDESVLSFGAGHTADTVREVLRAKGIHLVAVRA